MGTSAPRVLRHFTVITLLAVAVVARRPWEVLARPLALQDDLVADTLRVPPLLSLLSSGASPEHMRLLPLVLGAAAVVPAYVLGRRALPERPDLGGLVAGVAVALAPAMVAPQDLRRGVAEGFAAVVLVFLATRLEERFTPRRLLALAGAGVGCVLIAHTAVVVLAGVVLTLTFGAARGQAWRRAAQLLAVGAAVAGVAGVLYASGGGAAVAMPAGAARPATVPVEDGAGYAGAVVAQRTMLELERAGFGPWPLAVPAVALGVVALWRAKLRAAACAVPATWLGLLVVGLTGHYPFLTDVAPLRWSVRSSVGLSALLTVTAAVGVTWVVLRLWRTSRGGGAVLIALTAAGAFATAVWDASLPAP